MDRAASTVTPTSASGRERVASPGVRLTDLLAEPQLGLVCLVSGSDPDHVIRWTHATELVDASTYLRADELVCTVGSALNDESATQRFVDAVRESNAAGICFGLGDVYDETPRALVTACDAAQLSLITAPHGMPFRRISEFLAKRHSFAEDAERRRTESVVAELLSGIRRHLALAELLEVAATHLDGRVELTESGKLLAVAGQTRGRQIVAVGLDGLTVTWTGPAPAVTESLLETVGRLLDMSRHGRDVEEDLRRERTGELLNLVAQRLASPAPLEDVVRHSGLTPQHVVFSAWPSGAARLLSRSLTDVPAVLGDTPTSAILMTAADDVVRQLAKDLGLTCGYSRAVPLSESARALGEATAAFNLAQRRGTSVGPNGLTTIEGLLAQQPPDRLAPFVDRLLEPLLRSDRERRTSYIETLRTYLAKNGSVIDTARVDFLHVNTVRHRLERIRDLSGRDPFDTHDRIDLVVALWAHDHRDGG